MARVKRDGEPTNDVTNYSDLGSMDWKSALKDFYSPGVDTVGLDPEMFRKRGMDRLIPRHKTRDKALVNYDREYVFYRLFNLFVKRLGIIKDGVFDDELYGIVMEGLKWYSLQESVREADTAIYQAAKNLDKQLPGQSVEHWYQVLKAQSQLQVMNDATKEGEMP